VAQGEGPEFKLQYHNNNNNNNKPFHSNVPFFFLIFLEGMLMWQVSLRTFNLDVKALSLRKRIYIDILFIYHHPLNQIKTLTRKNDEWTFNLSFKIKTTMVFPTLILDSLRRDIGTENNELCPYPRLYPST
jgi:hypothetical protein